MKTTMNYQEFIDAMSLQTYESLQRAVELGKWPDGRVLTSRQREEALQAIIAWGQRHLGERDRVGYIDKKQKAGDSCDTPVETPLSWKD